MKYVSTSFTERKIERRKRFFTETCAKFNILPQNNRNNRKRKEEEREGEKMESRLHKSRNGNIDMDSTSPLSGQTWGYLGRRNSFFYSLCFL